MSTYHCPSVGTGPNTRPSSVIYRYPDHQDGALTPLACAPGLSVPRPLTRFPTPPLPITNPPAVYYYQYVRQYFPQDLTQRPSWAYDELPHELACLPPSWKSTFRGIPQVLMQLAMTNEMHQTIGQLKGCKAPRCTLSHHWCARCWVCRQEIFEDCFAQPTGGTLSDCKSPNHCKLKVLKTLELYLGRDGEYSPSAVQEACAVMCQECRNKTEPQQDLINILLESEEFPHLLRQFAYELHRVLYQTE